MKLLNYSLELAIVVLLLFGSVGTAFAYSYRSYEMRRDDSMYRHGYDNRSYRGFNHMYDKYGGSYHHYQGDGHMYGEDGMGYHSRHMGYHPWP